MIVVNTGCGQKIKKHKEMRVEMVFVSLKRLLALRLVVRGVMATVKVA